MNLGIFWRLHDLISPAVQQVIRSARHAQEVMNSANKSMQRGFNDSGETVKSLQQKIDAMRGIRDGLRVGVDTREIMQANVQISKMQTQLRTLGRLGGQMQQKGGWFGAFSSAGMQRVRDSIQRVQGAFVRANAVIQRSMNGSGETVAALRQRIDALYKSRETMRIGIDTRQITQATGMITKLQGQLDKLEGKSKSSGGFLSGLMPKGLGVGLGLSAAVAGFGNFAQMGMEREMITAQFAQFTKSNETAVKAVNDLNKYADATPYLNDDILKVGAKIAMNFSPNEIMDKVKMIGDIAGGNAGRMESIQLALSQVRAKGHLMGQDSNQFTDALVPIREYLSKIKGVGIDKIATLTEAGKISYADVEAALKKMTSQGEIFYGFMDKLALTTQGKWSTLVGTIRGKFTDLSMAQGGWINQAIDWANRFLTSMQPIETALAGLWKAFTPIFSAIRDLLVHLGLINPAGDSVQQVVSLLTNVINILATAVHWAGGMLQFLVGVFQAIPFSKYIGQFLLLNLALKSIGVFSLISTITSVGTSLFSLSGIISLVQKAWVALNSVFVLSPVGLIVTAVVALAAALYYAWNESAKFREVVMGLWGGVQEVWLRITEIWGSVVGFFKEVSELMTGIGMRVSDIWNRVMNWVREQWNKLVEWFKGTSFGGWIFETIDRIGKAWSGMMDNLKKWWDGAKDYMIAGFRVLLGIYTRGLSEVGIAIYKQFSKGYDKGVNNFKQGEIDANAKLALNRANEHRLALVEAQRLKLGLDTLPPPPPKMPPPAGGAGSGSGSGGGISDTVEGAKSKSITINLNKGLIETSNIIVDNKGTGLDIERQVVEALNRVLRGADRLALE